MHKDEIKGGLKEAEGKVQDAVGNLTDNRNQEAKGQAKQLEGKVQQGVGKVKDALHRAID